MKTIFITSFHALISRNILLPVLPLLLEKNVRIVLLVPAAKRAYFEETFKKSDSVIIEGVSVPERALEGALFYTSLALVGVENHIVRGWKTQQRYVRYYGAHLLHALFRHFFLLHIFLRALAKLFLDTGTFARLINSYNPDSVFVTDVFNREDRALLIEARKAGVPTVGMVRSWDNATTKGVLLAQPEQLLVPNEVLKEEMVDIHRFDPAKIEVAGIPHYDEVLKPPMLSREEFCANLGLNSTKKIILFAPGGKILYKHDAQMLALLKRLLDTGQLQGNVQFLVRLPPGDTIDSAPVAGDKRFVIDDPGTNVTGRKKESELSQRDAKHLHNSLCHADIVLTLASTMAIDGITYNKPVVVIGFDPEAGLPDTVKKFARYVHLNKFLNSGLVTVSKNETEFVRDINTYLEDPSKDNDKRKEVIRRYTYAIDGRSSQRVADSVVRFLATMRP